MFNEDTEDAPLCSECGQPMEETTSPNAQLLHGGVPFNCQSNPDCSEYSPDGVGSITAVNLQEVSKHHTPNKQDVITLDCEECGTNTVFDPHRLDADNRIVCPTCNADQGSVAELLAIKKAAAESLQSVFGKAFEHVKGIKFTKDDI